VLPVVQTVGKALASAGGPAQLKFMAQSWIVSLYTDCPVNAGLECPSAEALANFTEAVTQGWITWHAFPFNSELELHDASMLASGFDLTRRLDAQFGQRNKTVLSQRDVPGITRSAVPVLVQNNIRAISVGVNGASTPPQVNMTTYKRRLNRCCESREWMQQSICNC
jgi:hypothetical protein